MAKRSTVKRAWKRLAKRSRGSALTTAKKGRTNKFGLAQARKLLPRRQTSANKASVGKSLIIAGSHGMYGAAVLSATAATRAGSGYVRLMTEASRFPSGRYPDFLVVDWKNKIAIVDFDAAAIGPGLGRSARARALLRELRREASKTVVRSSRSAKSMKIAAHAAVLDADALRLVADFGWRDLPAAWIMTPHEGELAALLGDVSADEIRRNRRAAAIRACEKFGCVVVLKGHRTLVASPVSDGSDHRVRQGRGQSQRRGGQHSVRVFEIQSGNAALAKAGAGDVLTGVIAAFLAQGLSPAEAACLGVFVHGRVADDWLRSGRDILSLMASDLLEWLPKTLARVRAGR